MLNGFDVADIFLLILGLYEVVAGIATLVTGKVYSYGKNRFAKYTQESVHRAAPFLGIANILIGIALGGTKFITKIPGLASLYDYEIWIELGLIVIACLFIYIARRKMDKK